jgi:FkbM family methyltransferase
LAKRIFLRKRTGLGERFITRTITGALFGFRSGDLIADVVRMCGFWDWRVQAIAASCCKSGDTIIEVGANSGTETVGFANIVHPGGSVVAFEPLPELAGALRYNVAINGFDHVQTIEAAVTEFDGSVSMEPPLDVANSGIGFITNASSESSRTVRAVALDSMIMTFERVALVLIDVEGHEVSVLRGAKQLIESRRPVLIVEAIASQLERAGSSLAELRGLLRVLEYNVFRINHIRLTSPDREAGGMCNLLCIPRGNALTVCRVNRYLATCALMPRCLQPLRHLRRRSISKAV